MKLLLDENLSPRLVGLLDNTYPESSHVGTIGLGGATDKTIWDYAKVHGYALVSKDNDFRQRSFQYGAPPKVVWLSIGNAGTSRIAQLLRDANNEILAFLNDEESALLVLQFSLNNSGLPGTDSG